MNKSLTQQCTNKDARISEGSPHRETGLRLGGSFAGVVIGMKPIIGFITLLPGSALPLWIPLNVRANLLSLPFPPFITIIFIINTIIKGFAFLIVIILIKVIRVVLHPIVLVFPSDVLNFHFQCTGALLFRG